MSAVLPGQTLTIEYQYYDAGGLPENTSLRVIKWYRDSGAGFALQSAYNNLLSISPILEIGHKWRGTLQISNGTDLSSVITSETVWVGDRWDIDIELDGGKRQQSLVIAGSSSGAREANRSSLAPSMVGRMARVKLTCGVRTTVHAIELHFKPRQGATR